MRQLSRRARHLLALALCLAVAASAAGLVLSQRGGRAQAAAAPGKPAASPGSTQARADLTRMQALLNSGSASAQAALLAPPLKFAPGSSPIFPAGTAVTIRPGTLRTAGQFSTVQASLNSGKTVTLDLYAVQGHWRLFDITAGSAQTRAMVTPVPGVRLMNATPAYNYVPLPKEIRQKTAVIFVHGWMPGNPSNWGSDSQPGSMYATIDWLHGTWVSAFDWSPTNGEWAGNPSNGPALARYIHDVAQASKAGGGNGKVIIVAHSMGGLLTRYAANMSFGKDHVADDIGMVITLGTPNTGSFWSNAGDDARKIICWEQTYNSQNVQLPSDFCKNWTALAGMSVFGDKIAGLPELPSSIPLYAIAGNEVLHLRLGLSVVDIPLGGDGVVSISSALHKRSNGGPGSYTAIQNPPRMLDISAWHGYLPTKNRDIIAMTSDLIRTYIRTHPAPAPALGGDAFWLAHGGKWYVHGMGLQLYRGPSGLAGTETWNAYGTVVTGTNHLVFTSQPDGSLIGTFTDDAAYTRTGFGDPSGFQPDPAAPKKGDVVKLVPVAPERAKIVGSPSADYENTNICSPWLPGASTYCGA
jgi:pimeloyl-ACP methyl ester carboxylesterase